jgi:hypothetical protein
MYVPRLEIYLNQETDLCIAKVERLDAASRLIFSVPLNELKALEAEDASRRVGGTVLDIIRIWYKQAFGEWKALEVDEDVQSNDFFFSAMKLLDYALSTKTVEHNKSIEFLLQQAAVENDDARKYLENAWPRLREIIGT